MSADTTPISPSRFAAALKDLSLPMLHLKTLEIRNSIAHLQYSNDQLKPFAEGAQSATGTPSDPSDPSDPSAHPAAPDQDCIDAIRENELVIDRMAERIVLIRAEVEARGFSWREFQSADEAAARAIPLPGDAEPEPESQTQPRTYTQTQPRTDTQTQTQTQTQTVASGAQGQDARNPWTDGTFTTGTIRNGQIHMDPVPPRGASTNTNGRAGLTDEQLRAALEERMRELGGPDEDDEGGLHL